jgi:nitrous oxidase accessory protein
MYANENSIVGNTLTDNLSGALLMFSHDLVVKDNELSSNRKGATGAGILLKDNDNIFVQGNRLLRNKYGLLIEGAPQSAGATAVFTDNVIALNDAGIALTSNSPITFVKNSVIDNLVQVKALTDANRALSGHGEGVATQSADSAGAPALPAGAVWSSAGRGNYWSDYRGYDDDGDGVGDQPYLPRPAFAGRLDDDETLQLFQYTPAQQAIDLASDMFPVYRYDAVIEDAHPLMDAPDGVAMNSSERVNVNLLAVSGAMVAASAAAIIWICAQDRRRIWRRGADRGGMPMQPIGPG